MKHKLILVAVTGLSWFMADPTAAAGPDSQTVATADKAELQQIETLLLDPQAHERSGAARALANLASRYGAAPQQVRVLLSRVAADPDPEMARIASQALSRIEGRERAGLDVEATDPPETDRHTELEQIARLLADPQDHERSGAGLQLVNLAGAYRHLPSEVRSLLEQARDDWDPSVAEPVAAFLARVDGHPPAKPAPLRLSKEAAGDFQYTLAMLNDPIAGERWLALARLRDMPLPDSEQEMRAGAFEHALLDDDPMIRSYASFALTAVLAGDPDALAQVHVGPPATPESMLEFQPAPTPEAGTGDVQPGYITAAGIFVGTTPQVDDPGWLQPSSDARAGRLHDGYVDESGVFIGTAPVIQPGEDEQQSPP